MKRILGAIVLLLGTLGLQGQALTLYNQSNVLISGVVFSLRSGKDVLVPLYGKTMIEIPEGSTRFKLESAPTYRTLKAHDGKITTQAVPIMTFDDIAVRITQDGSFPDAGAHLYVEELY